MMTYKIVAGLALAVTVAAVTATATTAGTHREFENLKVLPKDISSKMLQHIMIDDFEAYINNQNEKFYIEYENFLKIIF